MTNDSDRQIIKEKNNSRNELFITVKSNQSHLHSKDTSKRRNYVKLEK